MRLEAKTAAITGGASGMGLATVRRFLAEGANVVVADLNEANGKALVAEVDSDRLRFIRADVSVEDDVAAVVAEAVDAFGGLDVMFNNAGVGGAFGPITEVHVEDWDFTFGVLCRGPFLGMKHAARVMREGGSIISTASVAGVGGGLGPMAYSAAKAALINLTKNAAVELAPRCIRVNCICPGAIATPLLSRGRPVEEIADSLTTFQPWPETGRGEHIAAAALYLASDESRFVTGHALVVDGGLTASSRVTVPRRPAEDTPWAGKAGVSRGSTGEEMFTVHDDGRGQ